MRRRCLFLSLPFSRYVSISVPLDLSLRVSLLGSLRATYVYIYLCLSVCVCLSSTHGLRIKEGRDRRETAEETVGDIGDPDTL